jgi:hypothetical protein
VQIDKALEQNELEELSVIELKNMKITATAKL